MAESFAWGILAGSSLVLGGIVALAFSISRRLLGVIMAFGAGVLISAVAFELVHEAFETSAGDGGSRSASSRIRCLLPRRHPHQLAWGAASLFTQSTRLRAGRRGADVTRSTGSPQPGDDERKGQQQVDGDHRPQEATARSTRDAGARQHPNGRHVVDDVGDRQSAAWHPTRSDAHDTEGEQGAAEDTCHDRRRVARRWTDERLDHRRRDGEQNDSCDDLDRRAHSDHCPVRGPAQGLESGYRDPRMHRLAMGVLGRPLGKKRCLSTPGRRAHERQSASSTPPQRPEEKPRLARARPARRTPSLKAGPARRP